MVNKLIYKKEVNGWLKKRKEFNKTGDFYLKLRRALPQYTHDREFNGPIIGKRGMLEYVFDSLSFMWKSFVFIYGMMLKIPYFSVEARKRERNV